MTALVVGFLLVLIIAMAIILAVALPHVREGAPVLTDRGERLTRQARSKAAAIAHGAADAMTDVVAGVGGRSAEHHLANHPPAPRAPRPVAAPAPAPARAAPPQDSLPSAHAAAARAAVPVPAAGTSARPVPTPDAGGRGAGPSAVPGKRAKAAKQQVRGGKARKGAARTR